MLLVAVLLFVYDLLVNLFCNRHHCSRMQYLCCVQLSNSDNVAAGRDTRVNVMGVLSKNIHNIDRFSLGTVYTPKAASVETLDTG